MGKAGANPVQGDQGQKFIWFVQPGWRGEFGVGDNSDRA